MSGITPISPPATPIASADRTGCGCDNGGHVQRTGVQAASSWNLLMTAWLKAIFRSRRAPRPRHQQRAALLESSR
jgi:hypothetical protein